MKKLLLLPSFVFLIIAIINLISENFFGFLSWITLTILIATIFFPVITEKKDSEVPILQIFTSLFVIFAYFSINAFFDFKNTFELQTGPALIFGFFSGLIILIFIMILKGK